MKIRLIAAFATFLLCGILDISARASCVSAIQYDTVSTSTIHFRHDRAAIDSNYLNNSTSLSAIRSALKQISAESTESIASIIIEGYSSPVGPEMYNQRLSLRRAQKVEAFLRTIPGLLDVDMILVGKGEDWSTFAEGIKAGYQRKNRSKVLKILDSDIPTYKKESKLKALDYDQTTWHYLVRNYMTTSRHAVTIVVVKKSRMLDILPQPAAITAKAVTSLQSGIIAADLVNPAASQPTKFTSSTSLTSSARTPLASIRTNLLVPALNVGAELPLGNRWSVAADYYFPWIWPSKKVWIFCLLIRSIRLFFSVSAGTA